MHRLLDIRILVAGLILAVCLVLRTVDASLAPDTTPTGSIGPAPVISPIR